MDNASIISIHYGHNATVALLEAGSVTCCVSEERFNRIKNSTGFPDLALQHVEGKLGGKAAYYVLTQRYHWGYSFLKSHDFKSGAYGAGDAPPPVALPWRMRISPTWYYRRTMQLMQRANALAEADTRHRTEMEVYFARKLDVSRDRVLYLDHHLSHALSVRFFQTLPAERTLVFTLDGEGDGLCATVNVMESQQVQVLSKVNRTHSLGYLYREITGYLGMKRDEHEFKVMGLAPYAKPEHVRQLVPIFEKLLWLNERDEFDSTLPLPVVEHHLRDALTYRRFDNIAGAIQEFTETITLDWVRRWIKRTGIGHIGVAGGVFMNVKMNQRLAELPEVEGITVVPSAGDESTVLGGCYHGYARWCEVHGGSPRVTPLEQLDLGTAYGADEIEQFLRQHGYFDRYRVAMPDDLNLAVARLLAENQVVARFAGRMEFGARALGNRSILANPSNYENVRTINEMIKNRDFWMPFAATILIEAAPRYVRNPKQVPAPFMSITFDTTSEAWRDLPAALHPYDKTCRPQILARHANPDYHDIIRHFKHLTGIGGVLNTSFNLHGEPVVESPRDAMHVFDKSGLKYLALGPFVIRKLHG